METVLSSSPRSIASSPPEELLQESFSITLELPTELDIPIFSAFAMVDQCEEGVLPGDSGTLEKPGGLKRFLRAGKFMPRRPPTVGDDSGDDCSASVE